MKHSFAKHYEPIELFNLFYSSTMDIQNDVDVAVKHLSDRFLEVDIRPSDMMEQARRDCSLLGYDFNIFLHNALNSSEKSKFIWGWCCNLMTNNEKFDLIQSYLAQKHVYDIIKENEWELQVASELLELPKNDWNAKYHRYISRYLENNPYNIDDIFWNWMRVRSILGSGAVLRECFEE